MSRPKQIIVMRKFPSMRTGKYCAQAAHASMKAFMNSGSIVAGGDGKPFTLTVKEPDALAWIEGIFTKIVTYVETEAELLALEARAREAGLPTGLVQDNGLTEFKGVPTHTALGIGPASPEKLAPVTGHLSLF